MKPYEFQRIILSGNLEDVEKCILDGYDTNTSYDTGNADDMLEVIYMKNMDVFKLLLPLTDEIHLEDIVKTILLYDPVCFPFLDVVRKRTPIVSDMIKQELESKSFNLEKCKNIISYVSRYGNVYFDNLRLTEFNYKLYIDLIKEGRINPTNAFINVLDHLLESLYMMDTWIGILEIVRTKNSIDYLTFDHLKYDYDFIPNISKMGNLCIQMGADVYSSVDIIACNKNEWIKKILGKNIFEKYDCPHISISLHETVDIVKNIPLEEMESYPFFTNVVIGIKEFHRIILYILYGEENPI